MSKYSNRLFITSPYSNISPPATCFDMARSSSRDSTTSSTSSTRHSSAPTYNTLPHSHPMSRTSSSSSQPPQPTFTHMRRSSSSSSSSASTWTASPYRSCLTTSFEEPSSYLSDDDLLCLSLAIESIPNPSPRHTELSTEEQMALMRQMQADQEAVQRRGSSSKKQVRFDSVPSNGKPRRPLTQLKRRSTATRRGLSVLNGPC